MVIDAHLYRERQHDARDPLEATSALCMMAEICAVLRDVFGGYQKTRFSLR